MQELKQARVALSTLRLITDDAGRKINPRGGRFVTGDLEKILKDDGDFVDPLVVREGTEEGAFYILKGERRFIAAKKHGLKTIKVRVVDIGDTNDQLFMLGAETRVDWPVVAHAFAVKAQVDRFEEEGVKKNAALRLLSKKTGKTRDQMTALYKIATSSHKLVQKAFEEGRLALTVYSRFKSFSLEQQKNLVEAADAAGLKAITQGFVDSFKSELKGRAKIAKINDAVSGGDAAAVVAEVAKGHKGDRTKVFLNTARHSLASVLAGEAELDGESLLILNQIKSLIEQIEEQ